MEEEAIVPTNEALKKVSDLANKQLVIEQEISNEEEKLAKLKEALKKVSEFDLPEAMSEAGIMEFKLTNGAKIAVQNIIAGKIDEENREGALAWLMDNGHDAIIKKEIELNFGKIEGLNLQATLDLINQALKHVEFKSKINQGVHYSTLNAFIKEQLQESKSFPLELFKVYIGRKTKISIK